MRAASRIHVTHSIALINALGRHVDRTSGTPGSHSRTVSSKGLSMHARRFQDPATRLTLACPDAPFLQRPRRSLAPSLEACCGAFQLQLTHVNQGDVARAAVQAGTGHALEAWMWHHLPVESQDHTRNKMQDHANATLYLASLGPRDLVGCARIPPNARAMSTSLKAMNVTRACPICSTETNISRPSKGLRSLRQVKFTAQRHAHATRSGAA